MAIQLVDGDTQLAQEVTQTVFIDLARLAKRIREEVQFEIVYQGSLNDLTNPDNTIIMREREPSQTPNGTWSKVYGFADGSYRTIETTDGNLRSWEQEDKPKPIATGPSQ